MHVLLFQWHILTIVHLMAVKYLCLHALAHFHRTEWRTPVSAAQCCPIGLANPGKHEEVIFYLRLFNYASSAQIAHRLHLHLGQIFVTQWL